MFLKVRTEMHWLNLCNRYLIILLKQFMKKISKLLPLLPPKFRYLETGGEPSTEFFLHFTDFAML